MTERQCLGVSKVWLTASAGAAATSALRDLHGRLTKKNEFIKLKKVTTSNQEKQSIYQMSNLSIQGG